MRRYLLPASVAGFMLAFAAPNRLLVFVAELVGIIVVAKLVYNEAEERLTWRAEKRRSNHDVADLIELYSFPGDPIETVIERLRGMPLSQVRPEIEGIASLRRALARTARRHSRCS